MELPWPTAISSRSSETAIIESTGDPEAIAILDREDAESEAAYQAELAADGETDE